MRPSLFRRAWPDASKGEPWSKANGHASPDWGPQRVEIAMMVTPETAIVFVLKDSTLELRQRLLNVSGMLLIFIG
jgi:hypothetical protein